MKAILPFLFGIFSLAVSAQDTIPSGKLTVAGWQAVTNPKLENSSKESGSISFAVEIDSLGEILQITIIKNELSEAMAQKCLLELRKMEFVKSKSNTQGTPISKGVVTFVFRKE